MPSSSRRTVVDKGEVGVYHCWNRCVQRAWLCGQDPVTGIDYGYRREVIEEVERQLAGLFAIDIGFHAGQTQTVYIPSPVRARHASAHPSRETHAGHDRTTFPFPHPKLPAETVDRLGLLSGLLSSGFVVSVNFEPDGTHTKGWNDGDFTGDRIVDFADFLLLSSNFGEADLASVPEPDSVGLLLLGLFLVRRRLN